MFYFVLIVVILLAIAVIFDIGWLKTLMAICLLIIAIMFMPGIAGPMLTMFPSLGAVGLTAAGSWVMAGALLIGSLLLDPEVITDVVEKVGDVAADVIGIVVDVAEKTFGSLLKSFATSPLGMLAIGGTAYYLLTSGSSDNGEIQPTAAQIEESTE